MRSLIRLARACALSLPFSVLAACASQSGASAPYVLETAQDAVHTRVGEAGPQVWTLTDLNPDTLEAPVPAHAQTPVCFESELERHCFPIAPGDQVDFVIRSHGVAHNTRIVGVLDVPAAVFDASYQAAHRGRVEVLVPEVYELVNIAIALSPYAAENDGLTAANTPYMQRVRQHFAAYQNHPFVRAVDAAMRSNYLLNYYGLKMNGYAFEFDAAGRIQRSAVYDRTGFDGVRDNALLAHLAEMQSFADESGFRAFYAENAATYREQIDFLANEVNVSGMLTWLRREYPSVRPYDGVKIVFSPLVGWNQSMTHFESNGYRELQPHVNFPYSSGHSAFSHAGETVVRGEVLFTELNHGFINPAAERYGADIDAALGDRMAWSNGHALEGYTNSQAVFLEYMNWGLVSLYTMERLNEAEWAMDVRSTNQMMVARGFPRFEAFNAELARLYRNRRPGQTLEDLYPQIIAWFASQRPASP